MDKKLLGKRINTARKERGWTSERLSEACNINATYLRQIEAGTKVPSLQVFVLLCGSAQGISDLSFGGGLTQHGIFGYGCTFGAVADSHTQANRHDVLHDPQRLRSIERLTGMRLAGGAFFLAVDCYCRIKDYDNNY